MQKRSRIQELLDFEIVFYERLVEQNPEFVDALVALGEAYTRRGWYEKGLQLDQRLTQIRQDDPLMWYNLACSYALLKRPEEALHALAQSIQLGYDDFEHLMKDPDLSSLRESPKLRHLLERRLFPKPSSSTP